MIAARSPSRRYDALCRFYTRPHVGDVLVDLMGIEPPARLLDLASGPGALSASAGARWKLSEVVTVDIDSALVVADRRFGQTGRHLVADALDENLPKLLEVVGGGFDATVCNPPYGVPEWRPGFDRILDEAGFGGLRASGAPTGAEALFVAQTLRLASDGGRIGLIVPDGLITGRRSMSFRSCLLAGNGISCVVQLPSGAFRKTEARAFLLLIEKGRPGGGIALRRLGVDGAMSSAIVLQGSKSEERLDYDFHAAQLAADGSRSLSSLGAEVVRGSLETKEAAARGLAIFHTSDFPKGDARRSHALPGAARDFVSSRVVVAAPGDILIARVDRSLHQKICSVASGFAALSPTVYRVRVDPPLRDRVLRAMLSAAGEAQLAAVARGVGPRMLGKQDLLEMPLLL